MKKGFTLIELLIAISLSLFIASTVWYVFQTTNAVLTQAYSRTKKWNELSQALLKIEENARSHPSFYNYKMEGSSTHGLEPFTSDGKFPIGEGASSTSEVFDPIPEFATWEYQSQYKTLEEKTNTASGIPRILLTDVTEYIPPEDKNSFETNKGEKTCFDQCHIVKMVMNEEEYSSPNAEIRTFYIRIFIR